MYRSNRIVLVPSVFGTERHWERLEALFVSGTGPKIHPHTWTEEDVSVLLGSTDQVDLAYRRSGTLAGYVTVDTDRFEMATLPQARGSGLAPEIALLALWSHFQRPGSGVSVHTQIHCSNRRSFRSARHLGWTYDPLPSSEGDSSWRRFRFDQETLQAPLPLHLLHRFGVG